MRFGSLLRRYVILIKPRPRRTNHFSQTLDAMDTFRSDEPNKTVSLSHVNAAEYYMKSCRSGICHSVRRNLPVEYYASHPEMASRFAASMSLFSDTIGLSPSCLVQGYPWSAVGNGTRECRRCWGIQRLPVRSHCTKLSRPTVRGPETSSHDKRCQRHII